jgi:diaminohydroxyphosphoribosylaminopyrimidine deaminase/5-amino-6-(5-phosphoribosylamino)uracil reductase
VLVLTRKPDGVQARKLRAVGAEVVGVRASRSGLLRWSAILAELYRRGLALVLIEGGAAVASSALESGVVDKVCVIHAPVVLGPGRNLTRGMKVRALEDAIRLRRVEHYCMGSDMMTEGYVHRAD